MTIELSRNESKIVRDDTGDNDVRTTFGEKFHAGNCISSSRCRHKMDLRGRPGGGGVLGWRWPTTELPKILADFPLLLAGDMFAVKISPFDLMLPGVDGFGFDYALTPFRFYL